MNKRLPKNPFFVPTVLLALSSGRSFSGSVKARDFTGTVPILDKVFFHINVKITACQAL